jgi:hypothetical protein
LSPSCGRSGAGVVITVVEAWFASFSLFLFFSRSDASRKEMGFMEWGEKEVWEVVWGDAGI